MPAQRRELLKLVRAAERTRFGRDHRFHSIGEVAAYQKRVPLRTYGQLWDEYWEDAFPRLVDCTWPGTMPYYAVSSGTSTGKVKYIPCSREMVAANKRAALDVFVHHLRNRPSSRVFDGKSFVLGGSTDLKEQAPGIYSGDISGIAARNVPWWVRRWYFPPQSLTFITDWEEKIERLAPLALQEDIRLVSGAPGWLTLLFEKLGSLKPGSGGRIADIFPKLELITHGGVSLNPYRKRFEAMLEGSRAEMREVYPASEGFVAIADRGPGEGLRLVADNGLFYEFVPVDELGRDKPTRHWLGTVETGVDYAIVLTTCAGLWSYLIGDVVRFVDRSPPRLIITGRTSYMLSSFGEHLTGELIETCVLAAAEAIGAPGQRILRRHAVPRERRGRARPPRLRRRVRRAGDGAGAPRRLHRRRRSHPRRAQRGLPGAPGDRRRRRRPGRPRRPTRHLRPMDEEPRQARRPEQGSPRHRRCEAARRPAGVHRPAGGLILRPEARDLSSRRLRKPRDRCMRHTPGAGGTRSTPYAARRDRARAPVAPAWANTSKVRASSPASRLA